MSFEQVRQLADAVLLEGYVLYPYRASSKKNQFRWSFGILAPQQWSDAGGCEDWWMETQCLAELRPGGRIRGVLRFLHQQTRTVQQAGPGGDCSPVPRLEVNGELFVPFDEGCIEEIPFEVNEGDLAGSARERVVRFTVRGAIAVHWIKDAQDAVRGRVVRERKELAGALRIGLQPCEAGAVRLRVRVENVTPLEQPDVRRQEAVGYSFISAHLMLAAEAGRFYSAVDPPQTLSEAAAATRSIRSFPVLAGEEGRDDLVLSAPIILYDHPKLAPESRGDFFDATEIDEMLTLRTATLTPAEKREARATDPRAARVIDRVDQMPIPDRELLHGVFRDIRAGEMVPRSPPPPGAGGRSGIGRGARVRLHPSRTRRTDAQDLLFEGLVATVEELKHDVDGRAFVAVTIDGDPAAELNRWHGRFFYYEPDEVELLDAAGGVTAGGVTAGGVTAGGVIDGSTIDGGTIDGGTIDGGTIDGSTIDGSTIDGSTIDGGTIDESTVAGSTIDGSTIDGGTINCGAIDGGAIDGGTIDGGTIDGGTIDGGTIDGRTIDGRVGGSR